MASTVSDWAILRSLDSNFLSDVKKIGAFNDSFGEYALFIMHNGDMYAKGKSTLGCLGLDDLLYTEVPVKIEHISGVVDVKCGPNVVYVYTQENKFYAWGGTSCERPQECNSFPKNVKIKQMACCEYIHIIILTSEGKVHEFKGTWALPNWRDSDTYKPTLHALKDVVIVDVACGIEESLALSENGDVYYWGLLGRGGSTTPAAILQELHGKKVIKVACGMRHNLVLTAAGEIYIWGSNYRGQLGTGDVKPSDIPVQICADLGRFIDIETNGYDTNAAVREDGIIFMWGMGNIGLAELSPKPTDYTEVHQVFAKVQSSTFVWNYKPVVTNTVHVLTDKMEACSVEKPLPLHEDVKLNESGKAWKPKFRHSGSSENLSQEQQESEELYKKVRGILNKLTPQNVSKLMIQVKKLRINSVEKLENVVHLVFEKAVNEPVFSKCYAEMCKLLSDIEVIYRREDGSDVIVNFRTLLLTRCQCEFQAERYAKLDIEKRLKEIRNCADPEKKQELQFMFEEDERNIIMKSVGCVKFIGEIFKLQMLADTIIYRCLQTMLKKCNKESLECLCKLLTTIIGKDLEYFKYYSLNTIFNQMSSLSQKHENSEISSRVRFMMQDVIDLRKRLWVPK